MGSALSFGLRQDDVVQIQFAKILCSWVEGNRLFKDKDERVSGQFFVYRYSAEAKQKKHFPWKARICIITTHQLLIVKARTQALRLQKLISFEDIDEMFYAPQCQLVKISLKSKETLYLSTGRCELPEQIVATITYFQNEIKLNKPVLAISREPHRSLSKIAILPSPRINEETPAISFLHQTSTNPSHNEFTTLSTVWNELNARQIEEEQLWNGSLDMLALMYTLIKERKLGATVPQDATFLVAVLFPLKHDGGLEHVLFRANSRQPIYQLVHFICNRYNIEKAELYSFLTIKGLLLDKEFSLGDYGLGTLFLTWQVKLQETPKPISTTPTNSIEILLPSIDPNFRGCSSTTIAVTKGNTIHEVLSMISSRFQLETEKYELTSTIHGFVLFPSETIEQHGYGNLYDTSEFILNLRPKNVSPAFYSKDLERHKGRYSRVFTNEAIPKLGTGDDVPKKEIKKESPRIRLRSQTTRGTTTVTATDAMPSSASDNIQKITSALLGMSSEQISAVQNFILSLQSEAEPISTIHEVGTIFHKSFTRPKSSFLTRYESVRRKKSILIPLSNVHSKTQVDQYSSSCPSPSTNFINKQI